MGKACSNTGIYENLIKIFPPKYKRTKPLGRPTRRLEDNIKMALKK